MLIAQGKANKIYKCRGGILRVSKRNVNPHTIIGFGELSPLKDYLPRMKVVDSCFGPAIFMDHIGKTDILCEFKPKWLSQSPDAPPNAERCRTCAIKQMRNQPVTWCPLQLSARHNLKEFFTCLNAIRADDIARFFMQDSLIDLLVIAQDSGSVFDPPSARLLNAMSARDITIIVEGPELKVKIVDLDPKSLDTVAKWRALETGLQPFYLQPPGLCYLKKKQSELDSSK